MKNIDLSNCYFAFDRHEELDDHHADEGMLGVIATCKDVWDAEERWEYDEPILELSYWGQSEEDLVIKLHDVNECELRYDPALHTEEEVRAYFVGRGATENPKVAEYED